MTYRCMECGAEAMCSPEVEDLKRTIAEHERNTQALEAGIDALRGELAKEQRLTRFTQQQTRDDSYERERQIADAWAKECDAHKATQAELERRTAWSNEQIDQLEAQLDVHTDALERLRAKYDKDLSDAEIAHQAEVARLREELERMRQSRDRSEQGKLDERAAHEATKAERDEALQYVAELEASHGHAEARVKELEGTVLCNQQAADREYVRREAAEARVAELERENARLIQVNQDFDALVSDLDPPDVLVHWRADRAALDQARGLLERCQYAVPSVLTELLDAVSAWLAANPAKGNG